MDFSSSSSRRLSHSVSSETLQSSPSSSSKNNNMQIFIKDLSGEIISLRVSEDLSIQNLTNLLSVQMSPHSSNIMTDLRLTHAGRHLKSSETLSTCNITQESTLNLISPLRGGVPPKKIRCSFKDCRDGAQRIVGDCGFCNGHFCAKHRLLEDHKCEGLEDCKRQSHERNAAQLHAERTHAIKGT